MINIIERYCRYVIFSGVTVVDALLPLLGISRQDLSTILSIVRVGLGAAEFIQKIFVKVRVTLVFILYLFSFGKLIYHSQYE